MKCIYCGAEITEGAKVCGNCVNATRRSKPRKKVDWLVKVGGLLGVVFLCTCLMPNFFDDKISEKHEEILYVIMDALFVSIPLVGIAALIKIYRGNKTLRGENVAIMMVVVPSLILPALSAPLRSMEAARRIVCGSQLREIAVAWMTYDEQYDDLFPFEQWCDVLCAHKDIGRTDFLCPGGNEIEGESSYALNANIRGMKYSEIPSDMVLLFEAKCGPEPEKKDRHRAVREQCRNPVARPVMLDLDNHDMPGCNIAFSDGSVRFVKLKDLAGLMWTIEGKETFSPELYEMQRSGHPAAIAVAGIIIAAPGLILIVRKWPGKCLRFVIVLSVMSGTAGGFFGNLAEAVYNMSDPGRGGIISGIVLGVYAGICYAVYVASRPAGFRTQTEFKGYIVSVGMAVGVVCSSLVHLTLIILYGEWSLDGMVVGLPFGILSGAVLGYLSHELMGRLCPAGAAESTAPEQIYKAS